MVMKLTQSQPYAGFKFLVIGTKTYGGKEIGGFMEISGISKEREAIEYREGNLLPDAPGQFIGRTTLGDVTLKRGMSKSNYLWDWEADLDAIGEDAKQEVQIYLLNKAGEAVFMWSLKRAWIKRIEVDTMNAQSSDTLFETVVLAYEELTTDSTPTTPV